MILYKKFVVCDTFQACSISCFDHTGNVLSVVPPPINPPYFRIPTTAKKRIREKGNGKAGGGQIWREWNLPKNFINITPLWKTMILDWLVGNGFPRRLRRTFIESHQAAIGFSIDTHQTPIGFLRITYTA